MHNFLKAKLNIETSEMSKANIQMLLLTENCEIARYAPSTSETIQSDYEKAITIISSLEKTL